MRPEPLIIVIDGARSRGHNIKELIEFMDVPRVQVASADSWREQIGDRRLAAIFVGDDLEEDELDRMIDEVGAYDPNTPIVRVSGDGDFSPGEKK